MFEFLQYDFMVRALVVGVLIGVVAPTIGTFLVVRRYSLLSDTLAHVSLVGVVLGMLLQLPILLSALAAALFGALTVEKIRLSTKLYSEALLALILSGSLALSTLLFSLSGQNAAVLLGYLFGSIATVSTVDVRLTSVLCVVVLLTVAALYKEFVLIAQDEEYAWSQGLPVELLNGVLMIISALTIVLTISMVGVLLIGALTVIPVVTALQWHRGFRNTLFLSVLFSVGAVVSGIIGSFYLNIPSGAGIVLSSLIVFTATLLLRKFWFLCCRV